MQKTHNLFDGLTPSQSPKANPKKRSDAGGLYDPRNEHDACGLGFIANMKGVKSHKIIQDGIRILENLEHRGATGADPLMGDGAGMLVQIPHQLLAEECEALGFKLPKAGDYGLGYFFMPQDEKQQQQIKAIIEKSAKDEGQCPLTIPRSLKIRKSWPQSLPIGRAFFPAQRA